MEGKGNAGKMPAGLRASNIHAAAVRAAPVVARDAGDLRRALPTPKRSKAKIAVVAVLALALVAGGVVAAVANPFAPSKETLTTRQYTRDVEVAVHSLTLVFAQADESVKAFQNGWLAPEGAASQFGFLHGQVQDIKTDIAKAEPPADMQQFHKQLGRSVSLTQQAMDAMEYGFRSGDGSYFELAGQKLTEARTTLGKAVHEL